MAADVADEVAGAAGGCGEAEGEPEECCICFRPLVEDVLTTPCDHHFHT
jgi:hypothetical protein